MEALLALWLPVLVSTVVLWVLSSVLWAALPVHDGDFKEVPDDGGLTGELRRQGMGTGQYLLPFRADRGDRRSEEFKARYAEGPQALIRVWSEPADMGKLLGLTVVYFLVVSALVAYVASFALERGAGFTEVFQLVGTVGVMSYGAGGVLEGIWFAKPLRAFVTGVVDALLYGLTSGVIFALMWPAAAVAG